MQANFATNFVSFFEGKKQLMSLWHLKERYCHGLKEFYEMVIKCFIFWWNKGSLVFELAWLKAMYMVYCPLVSEPLASLICEHQYHYKDKTLLVCVKKSIFHPTDDNAIFDQIFLDGKGITHLESKLLCITFMSHCPNFRPHWLCTDVQYKPSILTSFGLFVSWAWKCHKCQLTNQSNSPFFT